MAKSYVRLTQPLVRDGDRAHRRAPPGDLGRGHGARGRWVPAGDPAPRPPTYGCFSCSKATNEVNFAAQKLARAVVGSNNIDSCNRT